MSLLNIGSARDFARLMGNRTTSRYQWPTSLLVLMGMAGTAASQLHAESAFITFRPSLALMSSKEGHRGNEWVEVEAF